MIFGVMDKTEKIVEQQQKEGRQVDKRARS